MYALIVVLWFELRWLGLYFFSTPAYQCTLNAWYFLLIVLLPCLLVVLQVIFLVIPSSQQQERSQLFNVFTQNPHAQNLSAAVMRIYVGKWVGILVVHAWRHLFMCVIL